jgi:hypothetical protein
MDKSKRRRSVSSKPSKKSLAITKESIQKMRDQQKIKNEKLKKSRENKAPSNFLTHADQLEIMSKYLQETKELFR